MIRRGGVIAALLGAGMALGLPPFHLWPITLLALVLLLRLLHCARAPQQALLWGWAAGFGYFLVALHWLIEPFLIDPTRHLWMAPFALAAMAAGLALFWGLFAGVAHKISGGWAFALMLVGAELARSMFFTGFPWAQLSYTLAETPLAQHFAVFGPEGMLMVLLGLASLAAFHGSRGALAALAIFAGLWGAGQGRLNAPDVNADYTIRLVQPNAVQAQKWDPAFAPLFFDRLMHSSAAQGAPDLVIWPESALPELLNYADPLLADMMSLDQPILFGALRRDEQGRAFNSALVLQDGALGAPYDKAHLVPFGEYLPLRGLFDPIGLGDWVARFGGFAAGARVQPLMDLPQGLRARVLICYEAIFPVYAKTAHRPDLLIHVTNDAWFGRTAGPQQHLAQARLRAIEQGLPMARVANTGISAMIDPFGRIIAQMPMGAQGHVDAPLPQALPPTVYALYGDLINIMLLGALVLAAIRLRINRH